VEQRDEGKAWDTGRRIGMRESTLEETDVELPGLLPLVLRRTHLSTYNWGQWFGPSWASTLDERLELDGEASSSPLTTA
jgi:hypothetical protein